MFGPWIEIWLWFKGLWPRTTRWKRPHFSFIFLHYSYLIFVTLLSSAIISGTNNIRYIDAIFLCSGSATQSGLNTVNLNDVYLYQQVVLFFVACICNPIFMNSMIVFIRLYWFEKRFQKVVLEARDRRRTRTWSRTASQAREGNDNEDVEAIGNLFVIHPGDKTMNDAEHVIAEQNAKDPTSTSSSSDVDRNDQINDANKKGNSEGNGSNLASTADYMSHREITFADEVKSTGRLPAISSPDQHIAILENQRNNQDEGTLYIPGPREFDEGQGPQRLNSAKTRDSINDDQANQPPFLATRQGQIRHESNDSRRRSIALKNSLETKLKLDKAGRAITTATTGVIKKLGFVIPDSDEDTSREHNNERNVDADTHQALRRRGRTSTFSSFVTTSEADRQDMPYLSYQPTVGRNSFFVDLTEEQREELGGIEYRALKTLAVVLCGFFIGFHLLGLISYVAWIHTSTTWGPVVDADGVNRSWWGIFTAASMFNDLGYTLTPDSMQSFQKAVFPLLLGSYLIIIGNTGFPCMLRFFIWTLSKLVPKRSSVWEELRFLLDHPRRCFTLLFPSKATWWLFWVLVLLNSVDLLFFIILDLKDPTVTMLSPGIRVLDGLFQAISTRTAGFAVVNLANLHPAVQVSYMIMMYISVLPIAISVRRTNVYEEQSLGVYGSSSQDDNDAANQSYVGSHLRRQLSFDLWYLFLGFFIIAIVEGDQIQDDTNGAFTLFAILFEIVSAYGTVGLSLGYPGIDPSFSAEFHTVSKLVIIAMQIRGRHRGLPYALDKAILLPSDSLQSQEIHDAARRLSTRRPSDASGLRLEHPISHHNTKESVGNHDVTSNGVKLNRADFPTTSSQAITDDRLSRSRSQNNSPSIGGLISRALGAGPARPVKEQLD